MTGLRDPEDGLSRLRALAKEISTVVGRLHVPSEPAPPNTAPAPRESSDPRTTEAKSADYIEALLRLRRRREHMFGERLFADPAWDMLLDLALAHRQQRSISVSSLCIAAAVPPTTALRWIGTMTDRGLLFRQRDAADGRRQYLRLTARASQLLDMFVEEMGREMQRVVVK